MKTFDNAWIVQTFEDHPTFFTKGMFGGLAVYLHGRLMMVLVEPPKTGRWKWHGVFVCTAVAHHASLTAEFPPLVSHDLLRKWLYIGSSHDEFDTTMERIASAIARDDRRFGVQPRPRKTRAKTRSHRRKP